MTPFARAVAALAALLFPRVPAREAPVATRAASIGAAIDAVTAAGEGAGGPPLVIGFGELHQVAATTDVPSSLRRFTADVLPRLAPRASDLIVETWVADGRCGQREAAVVADVGRVTERPAETESEIVSLLRHAKEAGVRPHILRVSCDDYRALMAGASGGGAAVDYQRMLSLTRAKLEAEILAVLAARPAGDAAAGKAVLVYGGALHNDLYPDPALAPFSYGPAIFHATAGRYVEVDLYVPEYLERSAAMRGEAWYGAWRGAGAGVVVIRRSGASAVVVFSRGAMPAPAASPHL